jgi:response regulator RpfG family c-di-GMP phosphodiesterase
LRRLYATLSHINRASRHAKNWEDLFRETCNGAVLHGKFDLAWAGLIGHATHQVTPFCFSGREGGYLRNIRISIDDNVPEGLGPTGLAVREKRVVYVNDTGTDDRVVPWRDQLLQHGFRSLASLPIASGGSVIGALVLYSGDAGLFEDDQLQLMEDMSFEISYALESFEREAAHSNAEEERQRALALTQKALHDSIQAIAYTLEMRDPYTAGHQRQVSAIATAIAREMKLPEQLIEGIHFGSLIHDLGKIALPSEILTRPRRLTPLEMQLIETHPEAGYEIVKNIDYPWPVAEMIYQHHERMDGSGYPRGLKGDEILLERASWRWPTWWTR